MHISLEQLESLLSVGTIEVEVGGDAIAYKATTDHTLSGWALNADVEVVMWDYELKYEDDEEGEFEAGSIEMWVALITRMRDALASMMLVGHMRVDPGVEYGLSDEETAAVYEAINSLPEDFFEITLEDAISARMAVLEGNRVFVSGCKQMLNEIRKEGMKRGFNKEERTNMTLGEVFDLSKATTPDEE